MNVNMARTLFAVFGIALITCITFKYDGPITWFFWSATIVFGWIYLFLKMKANYNKIFEKRDRRK